MHTLNSPHSQYFFKRRKSSKSYWAGKDIGACPKLCVFNEVAVGRDVCCLMPPSCCTSHQSCTFDFLFKVIFVRLGLLPLLGWIGLVLDVGLSMKIAKLLY